jgi:hypothetical protein
MSYCPRSGCKICGLRTWVEILPGSGCVAPLFSVLCALSRSVRRAAAPKCPASAAKIQTAIPTRRGRRRIPVRRRPVRRPRTSRPWKASRCPRRSRPIRRPTAPDRTVPNPMVPSPTVPSPTVPNTPHCRMTSPSTDECNRRRRRSPLRRNPLRPMRRRPFPLLNTRHSRGAAIHLPRRHRGLSIRILQRQEAGLGSLMPRHRARRHFLRPLTLPQ